MVSACSVPHANLYVQSDICGDNLIRAAYKIIHRNSEFMQKLLTENEIKDKIKNYTFEIGGEYNFFWLSPIDGSKYYFLIQEGSNNTALLRLYSIKRKKYSYANTLTFIDTEEVNDCIVSSNKYGFNL